MFFIGYKGTNQATNCTPRGLSRAGYKVQLHAYDRHMTSLNFGDMGSIHGDYF